MPGKRTTHRLVFAITIVALLAIEAVAEPSPTPEIRGRYELSGDGRILQEDTLIEFETTNGVVGARGTVAIHGLRYREGEWMYGWIELPGRTHPWRCKLWKRGPDLYLRIYEPNRYSTHRLRPVSVF